MGDEVLARLAALVGVALAGEGERALDRRRVSIGRRRRRCARRSTASRSPSSARSSAVSSPSRDLGSRAAPRLRRGVSSSWRRRACRTLTFGLLAAAFRLPFGRPSTPPLGALRRLARLSSPAQESPALLVPFLVGGEGLRRSRSFPTEDTTRRAGGGLGPIRSHRSPREPGSASAAAGSARRPPASAWRTARSSAPTIRARARSRRRPAWRRAGAAIERAPERRARGHSSSCPRTAIATSSVAPCLVQEPGAGARGESLEVGERRRIDDDDVREVARPSPAAARARPSRRGPRRIRPRTASIARRRRPRRPASRRTIASGAAAEPRRARRALDELSPPQRVRAEHQHRLAAGRQRGDRRDPGAAAPVHDLAPPRTPVAGPPEATQQAAPSSGVEPAPPLLVGIGARERLVRPGRRPRPGRARPSTTRGSTAPFHSFSSSSTETSTGSTSFASASLPLTPKATPSAELPPLSSRNRACLSPSPIGRTSRTRADGTSSRTPGLPLPNGARRSSASATSCPRLSPPTTASIASRRPAAAGR